MERDEQSPGEVLVDVAVAAAGAANQNSKAQSTRSTAEFLPSNIGGYVDPLLDHASDECAQAHSRRLMWLLFGLGWLCPPCWWFGVLLGLGICHVRGLSSIKNNSSSVAAWRGCVAMTLISTVAISLGFSIYYGSMQLYTPSKQYFYTLRLPANSSLNSAFLMQPSTPEACAAVGEAIHYALELPDSYPMSKVDVRLIEGTPVSPNSNRILLTDSDELTKLQSNSVTWAFQFLYDAARPAAAAVDAAINSEDTANTLLLELVAVGFADAGALGQLSGAFASSTDMLAAQHAASATGAVLDDKLKATELLQYPAKPLPSGACTCRLAMDKSRHTMECPSPWSSPAGTGQVPPALQIVNGTLVEKLTGKPAVLHGLNYFGWNTDTPNFDGLWAYNDDEVPEDSSIEWEQKQLLNISWWGKRRMTNDFAAVAHRIKLLGFNALRVQFTFRALKKELPSADDPEFYPCLLDSDDHIGFTKTMDPLLHDWFSASDNDIPELALLLPKYTGMPHPPPSNTGNPQCDTLPWSVPFKESYQGKGPSLNLTMCNWYLPQGAGVTAVHRFLWQLQYLVSQGFYLMLDFASHDDADPNLVHPQLLAENWANLWQMLKDIPEYEEHLAGRIFPDLVNEPTRWNCQWQKTCKQPEGVYAGACAPMVQSYGMSAAAIWRLDDRVPLFINGLGQKTRHQWQPCSGDFPTMVWGDGFITSKETVQEYGLGHPATFFSTASRMQRSSAGLVLAPHVYPPSITWNTNETAAEAAHRWDISWGLKMQGLDTVLNGSRLPPMPVALGEIGAYDFGDNSNSNTDTTIYSAGDRAWLNSTAAYLKHLGDKTRHPVSWFFWVWNANSYDTKGIVGPQTTWREVQWTKVRMLMQHFKLRPWYCAYFETFCENVQY